MGLRRLSPLAALLAIFVGSPEALAQSTVPDPQAATNSSLPTLGTGQDDPTAVVIRGPVAPTADTTPSVVTLDDSLLTGRVKREGPVDISDPNAPLEAARRLRKTKEDPYAPLGVRSGSFIYYPSVDVTTGYSTNANGTAGGSGSGTVTISPELKIQSDWARHAASLSLRGAYQTYTDSGIDPVPSVNVDATARLDLANHWTADFAAGYGYTTQSVSDANYPAGVDSPPGVHTMTGSAALNGLVGPGEFTLEGRVARSSYENGTSAGVVVDQSDRNNTLLAARLRLGYQVWGGFTPFVEGEFGWRIYDQTVDNNGLKRSGQSMGLRAGAAFDDDPIIKGELALGLLNQAYDDAGLASISAFSVDGNLVWSPSELTTVTFAAATAINPSTSATSSGSTIYDGSVDFAYAYRRNVTLHMKASVKREAYEGSGQVDDTYDVGLGSTWKLNRNLWLTSNYVHEWLSSSASSADYSSDSFTVGARLQR